MHLRYVLLSITLASTISQANTPIPDITYIKGRRKHHTLTIEVKHLQLKNEYFCSAGVYYESPEHPGPLLSRFCTFYRFNAKHMLEFTHPFLVTTGAKREGWGSLVTLTALKSIIERHGVTPNNLCPSYTICAWHEGVALYKKWGFSLTTKKTSQVYGMVLSKTSLVTLYEQLQAYPQGKLAPRDVTIMSKM